MNKQEVIKQAQVLEKELAALKKIIEAPEVSPEERFLQFVENVEIKRDLEMSPNSIFFFNGDKFLAEYHTDYPGKLWIAWDIWSVFKNEYKMQYVEIQAFMCEQVEKHFKMKISEPFCDLQTWTTETEKHFKIKVSEPYP